MGDVLQVPELAQRRDAHLAAMADWSECRLSYTNMVEDQALVAIMDAAEVQKHAAAAMAFGFLAALQEAARA